MRIGSNGLARAGRSVSDWNLHARASLCLPLLGRRWCCAQASNSRAGSLYTEVRRAADEKQGTTHPETAGSLAYSTSPAHVFPAHAPPRDSELDRSTGVLSGFLSAHPLWDSQTNKWDS